MLSLLTEHHFIWLFTLCRNIVWMCREGKSSWCERTLASPVWRTMSWRENHPLQSNLRSRTSLCQEYRCVFGPIPIFVPNLHYVSLSNIATHIHNSKYIGVNAMSCIICNIVLLGCVSFHKVRYMKIIEKSGYQALPWVRYITQSGGKLEYYLHICT